MIDSINNQAFVWTTSVIFFTVCLVVLSSTDVDFYLVVAKERGERSGNNVHLMWSLMTDVFGPPSQIFVATISNLLERVSEVKNTLGTGLLSSSRELRCLKTRSFSQTFKWNHNDSITLFSV